jgi:uncharacterized protein
MMESNQERGLLPQATRDTVAKLLGREPRGLRAVPVLTSAGEPSVIRVGSLIDGKPFPTLFWLVDAKLCYRIDTVEASGLIQQLQQQVNDHPELLAAMAADHRAHIVLRNQYIDEQEKSELEALGFYEVLQKRGIGGIADFTRIRCLHTWYGAHLVEANTIGRLLDAYWASGE